jgi:DNA-directed RNA polymerase specialized sigma24 family protein
MITNWEYLPPMPLGHLATPNVTPERAAKIFTAYIHGCTKGEIARVFGERLDVVKAVVGVARDATLKAQDQ